MKYSPHEYQAFATNFIISHPVSAIFLDCGLGKTVITLTAIDELIYNSFEVNRVLVIGPLRVGNVWREEIKKWDHLTHLKISVAIGSEAERLAAFKQDADIYYINRENVQWLIEKSSIPFDFDMVVIDELSSFKSGQAKRFKSLMKMRSRVKRIVGLTGTPSSNGLMDLWAEFRLLDMGQRLGRYIGQYRRAYFVPDKRNGDIIYSYKPVPGAENAIYKNISDITISMKGSDYLKMPKCVINEVPVWMEPPQRELYDRLKQEMVISLKNVEIDAANAAALSGKLLQMANGAVYDGMGEPFLIHDEKLNALEDLIEGANGKPVLIAYWYRHDLDRIRERFDVREIRTSKDIEDWNAGKIPVAIIHPAAAGHGLNLQAGGSTLIWFGLTWSLELYQQTNARLYRQGAERYSRDPPHHHQRHHRRRCYGGSAEKRADTDLSD